MIGIHDQNTAYGATSNERFNVYWAVMQILTDSLRQIISHITLAARIYLVVDILPNSIYLLISWIWLGHPTSSAGTED